MDDDDRHDCDWYSDEDGVWWTACNNGFEFGEGGPTEDGFNFCPYCGGVITGHKFQLTEE